MDVHVAAGCLQAVMSLAHEELVEIVQQERRTYQLLHATNATPRGYNDAKYKNLSNAGLVDQLKFIRDQWETHFKGKYVKELRGIVVSAIEKRNQLAHQRQLTAHGYRQAIATFERLLELIRAPPATLEKVQKLVAMLSQVSSSGDGGAQLSSTSSTPTAKKKKTKKTSEPTSEDAAHKARSYAGSRDFANAAHWISKAIDLTNRKVTLSDLYLDRAWYQLELGLFEHSRQDAEQAIACDRAKVEGYRSLCESLVKLGRRREALSACRTGLTLDPRNEKLQRIRGELKDVDPTLSGDVGSSQPFLSEDSNQLTRQECVDEATIFAKLGDTANAIKWTNCAIKLITPDDPLPTVAPIYVRRAEYFMSLKNFEKVFEDTKVAVEMRSGKYAKASAMQCEALMALGRLREAQQVFKSAFELSPQAPDLLELQSRLPQLLKPPTLTHIDELQSFHEALRDDLERYDCAAQEKGNGTDPAAEKSLESNPEDASHAHIPEDAVTKVAVHEGSELDWGKRNHYVNISVDQMKSSEGAATNGRDCDESPSEETLTRQQCVQEATRCASCGSITEAITWTSRAIALVAPVDPLPAVASIYLRRAEYSIQLRKYQDALGDIAKAIEFRQGRYAKASALQSKVLLELNRRDEARQVFSEALEQSPLAPDLVALQHLFPDVPVPLMASLVTKTATEVSRDQAYASALDCLRRYDLGNGAYWATKAIDAYGQELRSTQGIKKLAASYLLRAQCRFELQQHAKVVTDVEWALEKDPACAEAYVVYCKSLMRLEQPSDAFRACVKGLKIACGSVEVELRSIQADLSQRLGVRVLTLTKELDGSEVMTRAECTDRAAQCAEHGDFDAAIVWCTRAMTLISPAEPVALLASLYQRRAQYFIALKQFKKAIDDADKALRIREMRYAKAYRVKCEAFLGMSRVKEAVQVWLEGMKVSPEAPDLLSLQNTLGKAIISNVTASSVASSGLPLSNDRAQSLENPFYASIRHLKSMIKESPNDPRLYFAKAGCHLQLKQYGAAQKEAEQAIALGDTSPDTFITLCSVMSELRLYADALTACRRGLTISPGHSGLLKWESRLCALAPSLIVTPEPTDLSKRSKFKHEAITRMSRRDVGNAIFWLTKAIALDTDEDEDLELYLLRAECRFGLSQFVPVLQDAQHVVDRDTANVDGYYWMCKALIGLGRDDEALVACNRGCGFDTQHGDLTRIGRELKSKLSAQPQPSPPASSQLLAQAAATHETKHDFSSTIDSLTDAIESMDLSESATVVTARYLNRAERLYTEKEYKRALEDVDRAISACEDEYAPGYVTKCRVLMALGRDFEALTLSLAALDDFPDVIELQELHREIEKRVATRKPLAVVCSEVNPEAGLTYAADLLKPRDARKKERRRLIQLGVQCMGQEDYGQADACFSQAIALLSDANDPASPSTTPTGGASPKKARVYAHRARCRLASESFVSAHADALLAMKHCPSYLEGYRLACTALMGLESWKEALDVCDLGLENEPGHHVLLGLRDEINGKLAALA